MPKVNLYTEILPHYIKSEVTLLVCTIYISHSSNTVITQFRLQAIIKDEFYRSIN